MKDIFLYEIQIEELSLDQIIGSWDKRTATAIGN